MNSADLSVVLTIVIIAVLIVTWKILNNRRVVTRQTVHGIVTYTIRGYDGVDARKIVHEIHGCEPDAVIETDGAGKVSLL
jgi:hypothetical protein